MEMAASAKIAITIGRSGEETAVLLDAGTAFRWPGLAVGC